MPRLRNRRDAAMEQRIRRDLAFLFEEHGATVRSNTVDSFGFSQILVTAGNVEFRFTYLKREDDCQLAVGPSDGHGVWELPHVALAAATGESTEALFVPLSCGDHPGNPSDLGFTGVASVLKPRFAELNKAFAPQNYPAPLNPEWPISNELCIPGERAFFSSLLANAAVIRK